jgi:CheY-like chemotaxis protein
MIFRVLAVEDSADFIEELKALFSDIAPDAVVSFAQSYASAIKWLSEDLFDFVTLDLKLPAEDGELDLDPVYGLRILDHLIENCPGTPVIVLTGSPTEEYTQRFLDASTSADVWASGTKIPTVHFVKKDRFDQLEPTLRSMLAAVRGLADIEQRGVKPNIPVNDDRLIRIFVRQRGGVSFSLSKISGGLSGAAVYRLTLTNQSGAHVGDTIVKVGPHGMVDDEERNYNVYANRLEPAATPRFISAVRFGAGNAAAVAYGLAEGYDRNAFQIATEADDSAAAILARLMEYLRPWSHGEPERRCTIADVRRRSLADDKLHQIVGDYGLGWVSDLESRELQVRWCGTHGDFHGGNVLVTQDDRPTFIDYGDIAEGPPSFDWVTLELSMIFHKDGPARESAWPTLDQCRSWGDLDAFLQDCPFPNFVRGCRDNAHACGAGEREVAAAAYSYLIRQLRYSDTDKERALALLDGVRCLI